MFPCSILPGSWMDNVRTSTCLKRPTKALVYHHVSPSIIPDMFVYTVITIVETTMSNMIPMLLVIIVGFCHVSQTYLHWTMIMTSVHHDKQWLLVFVQPFQWTHDFHPPATPIHRSPKATPQGRGAWAAEQTARGLRLSEWMFASLMTSYGQKISNGL